MPFWLICITLLQYKQVTDGLDGLAFGQMPEGPRPLVGRLVFRGPFWPANHGAACLLGSRTPPPFLNNRVRTQPTSRPRPTPPPPGSTHKLLVRRPEPVFLHKSQATRTAHHTHTHTHTHTNRFEEAAETASPGPGERARRSY